MRRFDRGRYYDVARLSRCAARARRLLQDDGDTLHRIMAMQQRGPPPIGPACEALFRKAVGERDEAFELAPELAYGLAKRAYKL